METCILCLIGKQSERRTHEVVESVGNVWDISQKQKKRSIVDQNCAGEPKANQTNRVGG